MEIFLEEDYIFYQGEYKIFVDDVEYVFDGKVYISWIPSPKICFSGTKISSPDIDLIFEHFFGQTGAKCFIEAEGFERQEILILNSSFNSSGEVTIKKGIILNFLGKQNTIVDSIEFDIINFPNTLQNNIEFRFKDWKIQLTKTYDFKKYIGLYVRTFKGKITHIEGKRFMTNEVQSILKALQWLLSFASAKHIGIFPIKGLLGDKVVWVYCKIPPITIWDRANFTWFHTLDCASIFAELIPETYSKLKSETWSETLYKVLSTYIRCNLNGVSIENGIVMVQEALEDLAWVYLVKDRGILSPKRFNDRSAHCNIRHFLHQLDIPNTCKEKFLYGKIEMVSERIAKQWNWDKYDGLNIFTELRNCIVHPKKRADRRYNDIHWQDRWHFLQLGILYLELSILHLLNYNGSYQNRLGSRWKGDTELVPWVKTTKATL